ncbi:muscle M-line assembly protein unc-89-like isoform X2 [Coccinella septempunctata]|nr:muscle M-line assembly protein unc-89-like isoform X2 [Coccinella septempunctata]
MAVENKTEYTDDDEDLEALRLAALNSLKKKSESSETTTKQDFKILPYNNYKGSFRGGKRRFFPGSSSRGNRNGQYVVRNSNLISIPTSTHSLEKIDSRTLKFSDKVNDPPKLVLPQDRYANATTQEAENDGPSSKFDRYDNSNSESEDDDEISDTKLERSDSLEALMEELDAEISGEPTKERKTKVRKEPIVEEKKIESNLDEEIQTLEASTNDDEGLEKTTSEEAVHQDSPARDIPKSSESEVKNTTKDETKVEGQTKYSNKPQLQKSPIQRKIPNRRINNGRVFKPFPPPNNSIMLPNQPFMNPLQLPQFTTVYNTVPSYSIPEVFPLNVPPPFIPPPPIQTHSVPIEMQPVGFNVPPLKPLVIEPQDSVPMGPLSPRSAAFVLQNRAIVEKRKRSPRRSFSRSPSPPHRRPRYSKSPVSGRSHSPTRRSLSPVRRPFSPLQRTTSPRRSPARRSLSPYRRNRDKSPRRSPRRTRVSPKRSPKRSRESPKRIKESRRTPVKDRLGNRNKNDEKEAVGREEALGSPTKKVETKTIDPVLEARKRKFESKEINIKERVIRLKPKKDPAQKDKESNSPSVEDPKSRIVEESDDVRPKQTTEKSSTKPPVKEGTSTRIVLLPKSETKVPAPEEPREDQLEDAINELEMLLKDDEALELSAKVDDLFTDEEVDDNETKKFAAAKEDVSERVVANGAAKQPLEKKRETKNKWKFEEARKDAAKKTKKEPLTNPIENRKIEIKIRNPSKYEKNGTKAQGSRTVELTKKDTFSEDESEPEIIMEEEEKEIDEIAPSREGDLRAQLSRKRAERQNKLTSVEGVQSRLLQSALEGAVFKKKKSKKKEKEPKDVKLPIHLRLGIAHDSDVFGESVASEKNSRKKSKKRKHADMEQV